MHTFKNVIKVGDKFISAEEDLTYIYRLMVIISNDEPIKKGDMYVFEGELYYDTDSERYLELMNKEENKYRYKKVMFFNQVIPKSIIILTKDTKIRIECEEHHDYTVSGGLQRVENFGGKGLTHHDYTYYTPKYDNAGNLVIYYNTVHICKYSKAMYQEFPRRCVVCGDPEVNENKSEIREHCNNELYNLDAVEHAFNESRLTHPFIGFKHRTFEEYLESTYEKE